MLHETTLRRILARTLDEDEFLGPRGLRAASRYHGDHRFRFDVHGSDVHGGLLAIRLRVVRRQLEAGAVRPVWFPVDDLVLRGLLHLYASTAMTSPHDARPAQDAAAPGSRVATELGRRLTAISSLVPKAAGRVRREPSGSTATSTGRSSSCSGPDERNLLEVGRAGRRVAAGVYWLTAISSPPRTASRDHLLEVMTADQVRRTLGGGDYRGERPPEWVGGREHLITPRHAATW